jgi:hypothetical protein
MRTGPTGLLLIVSAVAGKAFRPADRINSFRPFAVPSAKKFQTDTAVIVADHPSGNGYPPDFLSEGYGRQDLGTHRNRTIGLDKGAAAAQVTQQAPERPVLRSENNIGRIA